MGKPVDNNHIKNFDELLEHLNSPSDDLDAFEQEALEGFASLEGKQEAIEMKQRLDKKMDEKLSKKRKPLFIYWSAAAGIALILGLVYLTQNNKDLTSEGLADNSVVNEEQLERLDNNAPGAPDELKQNLAKQSGEKANSKNALGENSASKNGPAQRSSTDRDGFGKASDSEISDEGDMDDLAKASESSDEREEQKPSDDIIANKDQNNQQSPASAAGASSDTKPKTKAKEDSFEEEKATNYFTARKIKKEKKANQPAAESEVKSEIDGTFEKSNIKTASINISESELTDKINKFFADKKYKKSFKCTLTINSDNKVESIVFQNPDLFHKSEEKEITAFFKKQKCFKNHEFSVYSTYAINYKAQ